MNIKQLIEKDIFTLVNTGSNTDTEIAGCYCCDLLSIAMSKAPEGYAWITIMNNINSLAVASLAELSCIIFAGGMTLDETALAKAKEHDITFFYTDLPIFDAALKLHSMIQKS